MFFQDSEEITKRRESFEELRDDAAAELRRCEMSRTAVNPANLLPVNRKIFLGQTRVDSALKTPLGQISDPNEYAISELVRMFCDSSPVAKVRGWKADAGEARLFEQFLRHVVAAATPTLYIRNQARGLFPIDTSIPAGAETMLKTRVIDEDDPDFGQISPNADDIQMVEISGTSETHVFQSFARGIYWSLDELESAAFAGVGLRTEKMAALNRAVERIFELIAYQGYAAGGFTGAFNDAGIALTGLTTGGWVAATADQILADFHDLYQAVRLASGYNTAPTRCLLPPTLTEFLSLRRAVSDMNVRQMLSGDLPGLQIMECDRATVYDVAGTGPRMMMFTPDPAALNIAVPRPFTLEPPEKHGLRFRLFGRMKLGGCVCSMPLTAGYADGM